MRRSLTLAAFGIAAAGFGSLASAQTLPNASFETPDINDNFQYNPNGNFTGGAGVTDPPSGFSALVPTDGSQYAFLQNTGSITQTGSGFVPGTLYTLSFDLAARNCCSSSAGNNVRVTVDGTTVFEGLPTATEVFNTRTTSQFTTTDATPDVVFVGLGVPGQGDVTTFVDNVRVNVVPEPASLGLLALGAVGLLARGRRRRLD